MNDIATAPVTGWELKTVPALEALMLRLDFLVHLTQQPEEANHSPHYLLTAAQCEELSAMLAEGARKIRSGASPGAGLARH